MAVVIDSLAVIECTSRVSALALAPDGEWLAWGDEAGDVHLHNAENGGEYAGFKLEDGISFLAIHHSDTLVVATHSSDLHGYERKGGKSWSHTLGGGCDHLAVAASGDVIACIDGARMLHLLNASGRLLARFSGGELMLLTVSEDGQSIAVADDEGSVTVLDPNGKQRFKRTARGEAGERVMAMEFLADGQLVISREALGVTLGDEEEIALEWWSAQGIEIDRIELPARCEVLAAFSAGVIAGLVDGRVLQFDSNRREHKRWQGQYAVTHLQPYGQDLLVAAWFRLHRIDAQGSEVWQVEHAGLVDLLDASTDVGRIAIGGDDRNDYTMENRVLIIDPTAEPYMLAEGPELDADLAEFSTDSSEAAEGQSRITDAATYADIGHSDLEGLLSDDEWAQLSATKGAGKKKRSGAKKADAELMAMLESDVESSASGTDDGFDLMAGLADDGAVLHRPPISDAGQDQEVTADDSGIVVILLDGSHSYGEDGAISSYEWRDAASKMIGEQPQIRVKLNRGNHTFTLTVSDADGASTTDSVTVQVA